MAKGKDKGDAIKTVFRVYIILCVLVLGFSLYNMTAPDTGIDSYVTSCEMDEPYTCLDASFDEDYVEFATYGRHDDIVVEGCAHMSMREHDNGAHVVDIYGFRCARGDNMRDIYIDGEKEGYIKFSKMTGW